MKTRLFFFTILLGTPLFLFSQDEIGIPKLEPSGVYWSLGYFASGNIIVGNDYNSDKSGARGYGGSIEITYTDKHHEHVLLASKNRINTSEYRYSEYYEITLGSRIDISKNGNFFAEFCGGGIGIRTVRSDYEFDYGPYVTYSDGTEFNLAVGAGLGAKIKLNNNTSLLFKLRFLTSLPSKNRMLTYLTAGTGIVFNGKKPVLIKNNNKIKSYFGAAILAGMNDPDALNRESFTWSGSYGAEINYRCSPGIEILLYGNYNNMKYFEEDGKYTKNIIAFSAGPRFYINDSPVSAFVETCGGLYVYTSKAAPHLGGNPVNVRESNPGINLGTGAKINIYKFADLLIKGNLNFLFSGLYDLSPNYFTVLGGFRFNF